MQRLGDVDEEDEAEVVDRYTIVTNEGNAIYLELWSNSNVTWQVIP